MFNDECDVCKKAIDAVLESVEDFNDLPDTIQCPGCGEKLSLGSKSFDLTDPNVKADVEAYFAEIAEQTAPGDFEAQIELRELAEKLIGDVNRHAAEMKSLN